MRIRLKQVTNVIKVDGEFARLVDIDEYGRPVYRLNYYADIPNSVIKGAHLVRITAYTRNPLSRTGFFQGVKTSRHLVKNVQKRFSRRKDQIRRSKDKHVGRAYSDITSGISNKIAQKILRNPDQAVQLIGKRKILRAVKSKNINRDQRSGIPSMSLPTLDMSKKIQGVSPRLSAVKSIMSHGIDPSFIGNTKFPLVPTRDAAQGIAGHKANRSARIRRRKYGRQKRARNVSPKIAIMKAKRARSLEQRKQRFHKSTMNLKTYYQKSRNVSRTGTATVPSDTHVIEYTVPARWKGFNEIIKIGRLSGKGASKLYFLFELLGKNNQIVHQFVRQVNHEKKMDEYFTPRVPPAIKVVSSTLGINRLQLEQMDPKGTRIILYRKFLNPKDPSVSRRYKKISVLQLGYNAGSINYTDRVNNTVTCIYRAIAVGPRGNQSQRYKNAISRAVKLPTKGGIKSDDFEHVSIFAQSSLEGVRVRLSNIPEGPCAAYVLKTDETAKCSTRAHHGHCTLVGSDVEDQVQPITSEATELFFLDDDVKDNRIYRYQCVMIYPSGKKVVGKVDVLHEHIVDFEQENVTLSIGQPTVTLDDEGTADVSFDISSQFTDEGFNQILALLGQAGVEEDFQSEISNNRGKLSSMIAVMVERQDSISGETETFSVKKPGTFVDNRKSRTSAGVTEIRPGRTYRYTCKVLLRDPGSLFTQTSRTTVDIDTDSDFELKVAKFLNPYTLKYGTLPSTSRGMGVSSVSGLVPKNQFLQGKSSIDMSVDVAIPSQRTSLTNLNASSTGEYENSISWSVLGSLDEIEHFIVLAEHDGVKSPIGTVHNNSETGKFEFIDDDLGSEIGTTIYSVVPVYADYTYGTESDTVSVTESEEFPVFTIGG